MGCKAPARRGNNYCLFHEAEHVNEMKITFPPIEDAASVAVAADQVIQALRDDTIDYRRAALLFSGLRLARINLKQLGVELGDEVTPAPKPTKQEQEDARLAAMPSLAEILIERLGEMEEQEAAAEGRPARPWIDIADAKAKGLNLGDLLIESLELVDGPGEENSDVPTVGLDRGAREDTTNA